MQDLMDVKIVKKVDGTLLNTALHLFHQKFKDQMEAPPLQDEYGVFGFSFSNFVVVAKSYVLPFQQWDDMVSCHKRAVISAINMKKKLLMYIGEMESFFEFDPNEVYEKSLENIRGTSIMLNFLLSLGREI